MNFNWETFLNRYREQIVSEWSEKLKYDVSELYMNRPVEELVMTTSRACDSFYRMIVDNDYTEINQFIQEITRIRLEADFRLDNVQKAFELYRQIVIPILVNESPKEMLCENIETINTCLAYTIYRFSNHFQKKHEKYLKSYAERLERDVAAGTAELKESEHKYKTLVENISDGYLVLNRDKIIFVNPAFFKMHGYNSDDNIPDSFMLFVAEQSRKKVKNIILKNVDKGIETDAFEYLRLTKDKRHLPTEINLRPSFYNGGKYNLCIVRDITKRVEMEKKTRETERMAYIGKLTTSLSHEIRNPLSSIKMNLQILDKNKILKGNDKKRLHISKREIERLEGILQELLDFAKPVSLNLVHTDINHIIYSCVELLETKFHRKNIVCEINVDSNLKKISADKAKIEQMLINLLLNAIDSVDDFGRIKISSAKGVYKDKKSVIIRIEDNGKGIMEEITTNIFEPFYTTKPGGTGIGLSNVKKIMDAHKGGIKVFNERGKGAVFEMFIPAEDISG